jgi:transcriptional regulator with XRE-family HTH domain
MYANTVSPAFVVPRRGRGHRPGMVKERNKLAQRVGAVVSSKRKAKGLSQEALAGDIDVSPITLSNIERGENAPTLAVFLRLVKALGIDATELAEAEASVRRVSGERQQLELEGQELMQSADLRDLRLLVGLSKAMQGR